MASDGDAHDDPAGEFLENVYAGTLRLLAEKEADPSAEAVREWVGHIDAEITEVATSDAHSDERAEFVAWTYGFGVAQVLSSESGGPRAWAETLADNAVDALGDAALDTFYDAAFQGLAQTQNFAGLPWLVGDAIDRTVETDTPIGADHDQRVELVAELVGNIAESTLKGTGIEGFEFDYFRAIVDQIAEIATTDEAFFHEVATRVADALNGGAASAWVVRVYPAVLGAVADTDAPDAARFDAIHARGRDALATANESALAEYHARSLGAVPQAVAPDLYDRASDGLGADAPTHLYRAALRHVRDRNGTTAMQCLGGLWHCRTAMPDDSDVPARAGVGFAACLALADDADTDPLDVLDDIETADLSPAVTALETAVRDGETEVTPEDLRADIDADADDIALADLEALAYSTPLTGLLRTPRDDYETALAYFWQEEAQWAISTLIDLWEEREAVEKDSDEYAAVLEGGVLLAAYIPLVGADRLSVDFDALRETIESHRDRLSEPVGTLFDSLRGEAPDADSGEIRPDIDSESEDMDVDDLEALVVARLLELDESDDEPRDLEDVDPRDLYRAALGAIAQNEMQEAVSGFATLWEERETVEEDSDEYEAVLAGGVLLAAHAPLIDTDALDIDTETIRETVASHRDRLSEPVRVLFDYLRGEAPDADPEDLREGIDPDADEHDFEEIEADIVAAVFDTIQAADEQLDDTQSDSTTETDESPPDVRDDYRAGLQHVVAGDDQRATNQLLDVWDEWPVPDATEASSHVLGSGVALAVLVSDDPVLLSVREEVREAVEAHRDRLPESARPVADHLLDAGSDQSLDSPDADDVTKCALETVEQMAFARLGERFERS